MLRECSKCGRIREPTKGLRLDTCRYQLEINPNNTLCSMCRSKGDMIRIKRNSVTYMTFHPADYQLEEVQIGVLPKKKMLKLPVTIHPKGLLINKTFDYGSDLLLGWLASRSLVIYCEQNNIKTLDGVTFKVVNLGNEYYRWEKITHDFDGSLILYPNEIRETLETWKVMANGKYNEHTQNNDDTNHRREEESNDKTD